MLSTTTQRADKRLYLYLSHSVPSSWDLDILRLQHRGPTAVSTCTTVSHPHGIWTYLVLRHRGPTNVSICICPTVSHPHGNWTQCDYDTQGRQTFLLVPVPQCPIAIRFGYNETQTIGPQFPGRMVNRQSHV